jgi:hypothetical protein
MALVALRTRQDQRIGRGSQLEIRPVELEPRGAASRQSEVADDLAVNALEDPRAARVCRAWQAPVIRSLDQPSLLPQQ